MDSSGGGKLIGNEGIEHLIRTLRGGMLYRDRKGTIVQRDHGGPRLNRRRFLGMGLAAATIMTPTLSWAKPVRKTERSLAFYQAHTGERLDTVYFANGRYIPSALKQINYILRDYRLDEVKAIAPALLDLLYALRQRLGVSEPFEVLSGYRAPQTNALLSRVNRTVAKHSLHIEAKAIDIIVPKVRTIEVARTAREMRAGGVGYYPRLSFVHVDVGDVRTWTA